MGKAVLEPRPVDHDLLLHVLSLALERFFHRVGIAIFIPLSSFRKVSEEPREEKDNAEGHWEGRIESDCYLDDPVQCKYDLEFDIDVDPGGGWVWMSDVKAR